LIIGTILAFCLVCCLAGISAMLITKKLLLFSIYLISVITVFIFFRFSLFSLLGVVFMFLALLYWSREISADVRSRIKFSPARTIGNGLRSAITLLLIAICLLYYSSVVSGPDAQAKFTENLVSSGSKAVTNVLSMYYKDKFQPQMSLDTFIGNISEPVTNVNLNTGQKDLDKAINQGLQQVQGQALVEARNSFLKTMGIQASGDETMQSVVEKIVRKNMDKYLGNFVKYIPAILALGLFFLLNIFNLIYAELIKSFSFVIFHVLVWLKFVKVQKVQVEAEKITL
jgi:hypothetical protein